MKYCQKMSFIYSKWFNLTYKLSNWLKSIFSISSYPIYTQFFLLISAALAISTTPAYASTPIRGFYAWDPGSSPRWDPKCGMHHSLDHPSRKTAKNIQGMWIGEAWKMMENECSLIEMIEMSWGWLRHRAAMTNWWVVALSLTQKRLEPKNHRIERRCQGDMWIIKGE